MRAALFAVGVALLCGACLGDGDTFDNGGGRDYDQRGAGPCHHCESAAVDAAVWVGEPPDDGGRNDGARADDAANADAGRP